RIRLAALYPVRRSTVVPDAWGLSEGFECYRKSFGMYATAHRSRACDVPMNTKRMELGTIPALGIWVDVRMFAAEGSTGLTSRQKRPHPSWVETRSVAEKHWIA